MAMNKDFGAFELKEKIGSGGMASVYLAVQKSLQRPVVLKILYPHLAEDEKLVQRFEREARAAAMMRHENIVQVIDCGRYEDVAYICMEFVEGMDIKKWIEVHGTPPIEMALLMLRDLAKGLEHAHSHRIIHRDIKPANIMLTPDGTIKIMDFGLARSGGETSTQMTMVGSVLGTPAYMSPEQATGEVVDERSDIFSAGVVAYELLGGQRPFAGDSYSTVLRAILTVEPPDVTHFNPLAPDDVAQIVRGMLQKDVGKRYPTIAQVRQELEAVIEQLGLLRGKDLLREYALNPAEVGHMWRRKRLSRHMDQGLFYENMGLGKIDDALLEFRRVLYLEPENAVARDHVRKLEQERGRLVASAPPAAAAPPAPAAAADDHTMVLAPGQAPPAAPAPPAPAPAAAAAPPTGDDATVVMLPGQAPPLAPPAGKPAGTSPPARPAPPPKAAPPPRPAAPPKPAPAPRSAPAAASRKAGLPVPLLAGVGALLVAVVVVAIVLLGGHKSAPAPESTGPASAAPPTAATQPAPTPAPATPPAAAPAPTPASPIDAARALIAAGKYGQAAGDLQAAILSRTLDKGQLRVARELRARALVRMGRTAEAKRVYAELIATVPNFQPDPVGLTDADKAAIDAARAPAGRQAGAAAAPAPGGAAAPPAAATPATLSVTVNPFGALLVDGETKGQNQKEFKIPVKPGRHSVKVVHPTLGAHEWSVDLDPGQDKSLSYDFLAAASGSISISSEGGWAEIYIDGEAVHHQTPWVVTGVTPGKHEISLVRQGFTVEGGAQTVAVTAGQQARVSFTIKKK